MYGLNSDEKCINGSLHIKTRSLGIVRSDPANVQLTNEEEIHCEGIHSENSYISFNKQLSEKIDDGLEGR